MYIKHKVIILLTFITISLISFKLNLDFNIISGSYVSIISIIIAIYSVFIGSLTGSSLSKKLSLAPDKVFSYKSELGVIKTYAKYALVCAILSLISTLLIQLLFSFFESTHSNICYKVCSSGCFGLFSVNFIFLYLILSFILNRELFDR